MLVFFWVLWFERQIVFLEEVCILSRITVAFCEFMSGIKDETRLLSEGTSFLAISGLIPFSFLFFFV